MVEVIRSTIINHSFYRFQMISDGNWMNWRRFPGERIAAIAAIAPLGDTSPWLHFSHSFLKLWTGSPRKWRNRCISQLLQGHLIRADNISMHSDLAKGKKQNKPVKCGMLLSTRLSRLQFVKPFRFKELVGSQLPQGVRTELHTNPGWRATTRDDYLIFKVDSWWVGWSLNHLMSKYI